MTLYSISTEAAAAPIWADKIPKWIFTLNRQREMRSRASEREREPLVLYRNRTSINTLPRYIYIF